MKHNLKGFVRHGGIFAEAGIIMAILLMDTIQS